MTAVCHWWLAHQCLTLARAPAAELGAGCPGNPGLTRKLELRSCDG